MGERTQYTPGTFSWADLSTTDQDAAKTFYSGLFGWEADDRPVGDGIYYSMQQIDGKNVAAISPQPDAQREAGVPPLWNSYITVESADDAAAVQKKPSASSDPVAARDGIAVGCSMAAAGVRITDAIARLMPMDARGSRSASLFFSTIGPTA